MPLLTSPLVSSSLGNTVRMVCDSSNIVNEALSIVEGLLYLLHDNFLVRGVVHQGYGLFTIFFIQLVNSLKQLPLLCWTTCSCGLHFHFCALKFSLPLDCFESPGKKSRTTLGIVKFFLKDREIIGFNFIISI